MEQRGALPVGVVIVTHNSGSYLRRALRDLRDQQPAPRRVVVVDSGSTGNSGLDAVPHRPGWTTLRYEENIGFAAANNAGIRALPPDITQVLLLNPDVFLPHDAVGALSRFLSNPRYADVGACSLPLGGFDLAKNRRTGRWDSTGLTRSWYGRWCDRDQGRPFRDRTLPGIPAAVPGLCGALMLCRRTALDEIALPGGQIFDERFFMYKEDIDLSLRLRRAGWSLTLLPRPVAWHCRGWQQSRRENPLTMRRLSATNEVRLHLRHSWSGLPYAATKWIYVQAVETLTARK